MLLMLRIQSSSACAVWVAEVVSVSGLGLLSTCHHWSGLPQETPPALPPPAVPCLLLKPGTDQQMSEGGEV